MSDKIKRFHPHYDEDICPECGEGDYVKYDDYARLANQLKNVREKVGSLNNHLLVMDNMDIPFDTSLWQAVLDAVGEE